MLVGEIYGLHEPNRLVDVPPDRQVVDRHLCAVRIGGFRVRLILVGFVSFVLLEIPGGGCPWGRL